MNDAIKQFALGIKIWTRCTPMGIWEMKAEPAFTKRASQAERGMAMAAFGAAMLDGMTQEFATREAAQAAADRAREACRAKGWLALYAATRADGSLTFVSIPE